MKQLKDILYKSGIVKVVGSTDLAIDHITFDSRDVQKNSLFIAVKGTKTDGHGYIEQAVKDGAIAIVYQDDISSFVNDVTYIKVQNSSEALGWIASNYFDNPTSKLKLTGITGTNGKTTTVTLLHKLFRDWVTMSGYY